MAQASYLIDSNAVIDYLGNKLPISGMAFMDAIVDAIPIVSVITKIEILGFNAPAVHYALLSDFMNDARVLDLSPEVVDKTIALRKQHKTKLPDAIIVATALVTNLVLISRNVEDFNAIAGLKVLNPHDR
jgi:hypothetical protein